MQVAQAQNFVPQVKTVQLFDTKQQPTLGREIIPAVHGEYYGYSSVFTRERPLYALMKCKSNKDRPVSEIVDLGLEANAFFRFNETDQKIISIKTANNLGLLQRGKTKIDFDDIWFAPTNLTAKQFMKLQANKNEKELVNLCQKILINGRDAVELRKGLVVTMMTSSEKYGMFLVSKITPFSIQIEACHILL